MKPIDLLIPNNKKYSYIFFAIFAVLTVIVSLGIFNIQIDNDVTVLLPVNADVEHEREKISRLNKEFPSDQPIFIGVSGNPFSIGKIDKLWKMWREIEALDIVKSTMSPFNSIYFKKFDSNFTIAKTNPLSYPKTEEELAQFVQNLSSNRYLVGSVISNDKQSAGIVVKMNFKTKVGKVIENKNFVLRFFEKVFGREYGPQLATRTDFCNQVDSVLKKYKEHFPIYLAGVPVYEAKTKTYMQKDIFALLIPAIFLMILTMYLNIRTKRGTVLPITVMLLSLTWTMGIIGWIRFKLNTVSILLPPIILTIGSSYTLHYLYAYYTESSKGNSPRETVVNSSKNIFPTIFMASLTTAIGFASFLTASIIPVKMFGVFAVLSIVLTVGLTFFLLSKILSLLPVPKGVKIEAVKNDVFSKVLSFFSKAVYPLRYLWVSIFFIAIVCFAIYIPNLKVETNAASFFKDSDDTRKSLIFFQDHFDGTSYFNVTVRSVSNKRNFFKTREGLLSAKKISDYFESNPEIDGFKTIGWKISLITLIEDLNETLTGKKGIPEDEAIIKRFLTYLKISGDEGVKSIVNDNFSAITFQVRVKTNNAKEQNLMTEQELAKLNAKMTKELDAIAREDGSFTVEPWGELLLLSKISKYLVKDQVANIISTVIFIFLSVLILFKSPYFSFFSLIPLSFGVMMNFLIMSIFNIPLDAATIMIAAIAIGVGVDNAIHFLLNYRKILKNDGDIATKDAIILTLERTSRPILFTAMALILGFVVFFLSSFKPIIYFGVLIALSMLTCTFGSLFILPSALLVTDKLRMKYRKKKNKTE
ncbi:MAG TPA: MMPL family transporter [Spirochaetota bacterium]|jgi:hypothetical protein|nr:MAG: multidrug efflux system subunit MdtC [Spirochaetes bacterium ADurb.Bin133]HNZ26267.1 MMPL family transporter [Spirochaetota bacterium]HPY88173.1 MMPL family transporter [Spirochaetota bacterium]HQB60840.1 MMPL family transporter [Spirochaetota bacterium]